MESIIILYNKLCLRCKRIMFLLRLFVTYLLLARKTVALTTTIYNNLLNLLYDCRWIIGCRMRLYLRNEKYYSHNVNTPQSFSRISDTSMNNKQTYGLIFSPCRYNPISLHTDMSYF